MKSPKVVKGKNIIKVLEKNGYKEKSRKGSHISLTNGKINITIVMPLTTIGCYKDISKKTGIPEEDFY